MSDSIWDTIDQSELRWDVDELVPHLDLEQWLVVVLASLAIDLLEVLSKSLGLAIVLKGVGDWVLVEVYVVDNVGTHASPVSHHALANELSSHLCFIILLAVGGLLDLMDSLEAGQSGDELEDAIYD